MLRNEFENIFKELKQYPDFDGEYLEWYKEIIDYPYKGILNNLRKHKSTNAPVPKQLIGKLDKEEIIEDWITECEYCKKRFTIQNNDMTEYEKHFRKCSKIDFLDRMSKRIKGVGITYDKYHNMSDDELEKAYRSVMDYYEQQRKPILNKL